MLGLILFLGPDGGNGKLAIAYESDSARLIPRDLASQAEGRGTGMVETSELFNLPFLGA